MANIESVTVAGLECGEVIVMAHNANKLSDEEWEANYLTPIRQMKARGGLETCANIVFAEGKGPTTKQRAVGNAIFSDGGYRFKVAVVTASMMVRGVVTAIGWFNPLIGAFGPSEWRRAFEHVRVPPQDNDRILAAARAIQTKLRDVDVLNRYIADASQLARTG